LRGTAGGVTRKVVYILSLLLTASPAAVNFDSLPTHSESEQWLGSQGRYKGHCLAIGYFVCTVVLSLHP
jgi:hypothetical protein